LLIKVKQAKREIHTRIQEDTSRNRNTFGSKLSGEMKELFEKWRRGK
jgi:hypothetical protein